MKHINRYLEVIKVPIEVGDTVLGGRFKNKKTVVKKIGKNSKGDITINDKPLLKYRIVKENIKEDIKWNLSLLTDAGFSLKFGGQSKVYCWLRIWKPTTPGSTIYSYGDCQEFDYTEIEDDLIRAFSIEEKQIDIKFISCVFSLQGDYSVDRISVDKDKFINHNTGFETVKSITIVFDL